MHDYSQRFSVGHQNPQTNKKIKLNMKKYFYSLLTMLTAVFALSSCEDVPAPYDIPEAGGDTTTGIAPAGTGTLDDPFNVEGVLAFIEAGENLDSKVYIKGYVTSIKECSPSFGNATFYIASEPGGTNTFYVYRCNGIDNGKITSEDQIKEGDEVIVYGKVTDYNGTKETVQKEAYIYSINGEGGNGGGQVVPGADPAGTGTQDDPFNVAAAIKKCQETGETATTEQYYVKGIVKAVDDSGVAQYGNITLDLVDVAGSSEVFKAFQIYDLGNKKFTAQGTVKEGDVVIVKGKLVNYKNNTPETTGKGEAFIYSLNGKTDGGSEPQVTPGAPAGTGTAADPFNVAAAIKKCQETGETATAEQYYVKGIVESVNSTGVDQYGNISINMVDVAGSSEVFMAFQVNSINGEKFTSATASGIKKGDVVVVKGNLVNYKGNTPETTGKGAGCVISVNGKTELSGGTSGGGNTGGDSNINADETFDIASFIGVVESGKEINGTSVGGLSFAADKGTNSNAPKFYSSNGFNTIRMYPTNTITITFGKNVKNIALNCDTYQNIVCVAEGKGQATPGTATTVGDVIIIKDINNKSVTIKNGHTGTGTAAQIRIKTIDIEYVK